jgi:transposase-like protein
MSRSMKARRKRRQFTAEFNAEAVRLTRVGDRSVTQIAKDLDLTESALRQWIQHEDAEGAPPSRRPPFPTPNAVPLVTSVVVASGTALTLVPNEARADPDLAVTPGILISTQVGGAGALWGVGVECSVTRLFGSSGYPDGVIGGVAQAQMLTDGTFRAVLAGEGAVFGMGLELGLAFRTGNAQRAPSLGLHFAQFFSAGFTWVAFSLNVPLFRAQGMPRFETFINFGPKVPIVRRVWDTSIQLDPLVIREPEWRVQPPLYSGDGSI